MIIGFMGGFGPVEIGLVLLFFSLLGAFWLYWYIQRQGEPIDWYWIIGIAILFLFGIIPGLVGIYLFIRTRKKYRDVSDSPPPAESPADDWQIGIFIFIATLFGGSLVATGFAEIDAPSIGGFVLGSVVVFLTLSYFFYGR